MNNICPGCGALYNVAAKDIGRRLKCKKCSSPLMISEAGIEVDANGATGPHSLEDAPATGHAPAPRPARLGTLGGTSIGDLYRRFSNLLSTVIFGFGAFLVIFQLFMPLVAAAKIEGRRASKAEAEKEYQDEMDRINKEKDFKDKAKTLEDNRKAHEENMKYYSDRIDWAEFASKKSLYLDRYVMMFGFLLVMVASLMFMMPEQPPVKRVVGAIVITAQMVFVFLAFLARSVAVG